MLGRGARSRRAKKRIFFFNAFSRRARGADPGQTAETPRGGCWWFDDMIHTWIPRSL